MTNKLLTEHHLEFLSLEGGCTGSSKSIHVKMPHCWKSHIAARFTKSFTGHTSFFEEKMERKNNQRGITWKLKKGEQSLLYATHCLDIILNLISCMKISKIVSDL